MNSFPFFLFTILYVYRPDFDAHLASMKKRINVSILRETYLYNQNKIKHTRINSKIVKNSDEASLEMYFHSDSCRILLALDFLSQGRL